MRQCKHKFQPRYNREWSTAIKDVVTAGVSKASGLYGDAYLQKETYVYDICIRCGEIICLQ